MASMSIVVVILKDDKPPEQCIGFLQEIAVIQTGIRPELNDYLPLVFYSSFSVLAGLTRMAFHVFLPMVVIRIITRPTTGSRNQSGLRPTLTKRCRASC